MMPELGVGELGVEELGVEELGSLMVGRADPIAPSFKTVDPQRSIMTRPDAASVRQT